MQRRQSPLGPWTTVKTHRGLCSVDLTQSERSRLSKPCETSSRSPRNSGTGPTSRAAALEGDSRQICFSCAVYVNRKNHAGSA